MEFQDDPYVHGLACGAEQDYGIDKDVYLLLVNGATAYLDREGNFNPYNVEFHAVIMPEVMPGGVPYMAIEATQDETNEINGEPIPESGQYMSFQNSDDRHEDPEWKIDDGEEFVDDLSTRYPPTESDDDEGSGLEEWSEQ